MNTLQSYYGNRRSDVAHLIPKAGTKVLEIGCGLGDFANLFDRSVEYWGVEPVKEVADQARGKLHRVLHGGYEAVASDIPDAYFDIVVCNDVIEHMPDHDAFLESIKSKFAPGAVLIGSVPNIRYVDILMDLVAGGRWHYTDWGTLDRTHLRFFTIRSLRECFESHQYEVNDLHGINPFDNSFSWRRVWAYLKYELKFKFLGQDLRYLQLAFRIRPKV